MRQIPVKQLFLKILGAGGDDDALAREHRRHQIGEGLTGAGARLADQHTIVVQGALDGSAMACCCGRP